MYDKIVCVRWQDPVTYTSWTSSKKAKKKKASETLSIGILISQDKDYVRLALDVNNDDEAHGIGVIPTRSVVSMKFIAIPRGVRL